ncbi:hypothetical protein [Geothrix sp. 21YS21S-4]|uniref:hypothetical protein n=1 Tax=Geothrix sp. 21YS21S-4 TaxID=3068889 RepID=UPI0027BA38BF|nr:hypothetical protein [Geothrix sp. 21YS21S-4]
MKWSVSGGGSIDANRLFAATMAGTFTVTAASVADQTKTGSTQVMVKAVISSVGDYKVILLSGEIGGQVSVGAEAKVVSRDQGGFTLATVKIFAGLKVGLTIVDVKKEKQ